MPLSSVLRRAHVVVLAAALGACGGSPIIPDKNITIFPTFQPSVEAVILGTFAGIALWKIVDPAAPNWNVAVTPLDDSRVEVDMKMKRFATGGSGEAYGVMQRSMRALMEDYGFTGYAVLTWSEGIESETFGARRTAHAVVRFNRPG
ncbi:MAG: hypothetical protein MUF30_11630 [Burkholderiales bacterium]|jgi:hypothetical protein|nr:hypothetical protein [Burkholderiales bacterium]